MPNATNANAAIDDYWKDPVRLFLLRRKLEKLIRLERFSREQKIEPVKSKERIQQIMERYSADEALDISFLSIFHNELKVHIEPVIDEKGGVSFKRDMQVDGRKIKDYAMESELRSWNNKLHIYIKETERDHRWEEKKRQEKRRSSYRR